MVESAAGFTACPRASSSKRRAISLGVVTPSPYLTEESIATLVSRRKVFEWTFECGRPSASIFSQTRRIAMRSSSRFVAVLSLIVDISHAASRTVTSIPSCMNCSVPDPGTLSMPRTVSRSSREIFPFATRSKRVTRIGTLISDAVGKVSSPRREIATPSSRSRIA